MLAFRLRTSKPLPYPAAMTDSKASAKTFAALHNGLVETPHPDVAMMMEAWRRKESPPSGGRALTRSSLPANRNGASPQMTSNSPDPVRADLIADIDARIIDVLNHRVGKDERAAKTHDWFNAAVLTLRDKVIDRWMESTRKTYAENGKRVYYLSLEFLIGRLMRDALSNMGLTREMEQALRAHGLDLAALEELEPDAALGNGGLGRLAACFMESLASLDIPAYGYGIRYVNGMFRQRIDDGWQVELPENWLAHGNPWEFDRRESAYRVGFGGEVIEKGEGVIWNPAEQVEASAVDTPVVGWRGKRGKTLRLWTASALDPIRLDAFNPRGHAGAPADPGRAESLVRR